MRSYGKLCAEFYDLDKPQAPADALDFFSRYARKATGPILEPMCGSGRFLVPLLEAGFRIEGVDSSRSMLQACRIRCRLRQFSPVLYEQYVDRMTLPRQYGLVFIPASSFSLITDRENVRRTLQGIYGVMLPGATFVVEVLTMDFQPAQTEGRREVVRADGKTIRVISLASPVAAEAVVRYTNRYELLEGEVIIETEHEELGLRLYSRKEFHEVLRAAGFERILAWKPYQMAEPGGTEASIVFECQKPLDPSPSETGIRGHSPISPLGRADGGWRD